MDKLELRLLNGKLVLFNGIDTNKCKVSIREVELLETCASEMKFREIYYKRTKDFAYLAGGTVIKDVAYSSQ
jgi:hypothetical protein